MDGARRESIADPPPSDELAYETSSYVSAYVIESAYDVAYEVSARLGLGRAAILAVKGLLRLLKVVQISDGDAAWRIELSLRSFF